MENFKIAVAILAIVAVVYFLIKKYETKLVLVSAGVFMALIALKPIVALDAFAAKMTTSSMIQAICSVLGFAAVLRITGCDKHLIVMLSKILKRSGVFLVPAATLLTFAINIALPSAAGCAAAVGAIFIPLMIYSGVHPAMAAAAIFAGTYGSLLSPGLSHNSFIAKLAGIEIFDVINVHKYATISSIFIVATILCATAFITKEYKGYKSEDKDFAIDENFKVNYLYAFINIMPLLLLLASFMGWLGEGVKLGVPQTMLIGVIAAIIVTRKSPKEVSNGFFNAMGGAYAQIMGLVIAAGVFVSGFEALGAVEAFNNMLTSNSQIAAIGASVGPFLLAVVTGSGEAAALAFNEAVTPMAAQFGLTIPDMGSLAALSAAMGRTMSPLAGAAIICAGFAKVSPLELAKRTAPGIIIGMIVVYFMLGT